MQRRGPRARPKRILEAEMSWAEVERIDRRMVELGRGVGAMRLGIGEGLLRLDGCGGHRSLGFPTLESYARQALGRSGRWAGDARALARRLAELPRLRVALVSGSLSWSMVELVARVATAEDEQAWIERALGMTVRAMRLALREERDEEPSGRVTITTTVDRVDALAFERTKMMVEALGAHGTDGAVEAMLAEGLGELLARSSDVDLPAGIGGLSEYELAWREELKRMREEGELACEERGFFTEAVPVGEGGDTVTWPVDAGGIDGELRRLASTLAGRDVELAHLARRCSEATVWERLGYASFEQYCRERVGLSASSMAARVALARRVSRLPELEDAIASREVGWEAAVLIGRVAGPGTVAAWIERATRRTVKHLREEVEAVELVARVDGEDVTERGPPDAVTLSEVEAVERSVIDVLTDGCQMSGGTDADGAVDLPMTTLRLVVSEETGRFWRGLERVWRWVCPSDPGSFVAFLVRAVMRAWWGVVSGGDAGGEYADVYRRDRWRCRSPVCTSRNVTPHHVRFRSRGGGEERANLVSLCDRCHLELVHGGLLSVSGDAGRQLSWRAAGWSAAGRELRVASVVA